MRCDRCQCICCNRAVLQFGKSIAPRCNRPVTITTPTLRYMGMRADAFVHIKNKVAPSHYMVINRGRQVEYLISTRCVLEKHFSCITMLPLEPHLEQPTSNLVMALKTFTGRKCVSCVIMKSCCVCLKHGHLRST